MNYLGQIIQYKNSLIIDASPEVMIRLRNIFPNKSTNVAKEQYKHTHQGIMLRRSPEGFKDLQWVMSRYPLEVSDKILSDIEKGAQEYDQGLQDIITEYKNTTLVTSPDYLEMTVSLRDHQIAFNNFIRNRNRLLLADVMGLGKTISSLSLLVDPDARPALIIVPTNLCLQWESVVNEVVPDLQCEVLISTKPYPLKQNNDVLITSYGRLKGWQDVLIPLNFNTIIFDEMHDLRHIDTVKRKVSQLLTKGSKYVVGLTGTPIYNYGSEVWSLLNVIDPNYLGSRHIFMKEWCDYKGRVFDTVELNSYLKNNGFMMRRTPTEAGLKIGSLQKIVHTLDTDLKTLQGIQNIAKQLAMSVFTGNIKESSTAARELDWKLRHATGVAKAKPIAEFAKLVLSEEDKVIISCWHRDVYDILLKELEDYFPVMHTGSESPKQKQEAIDTFIKEDRCRVFLLSLRSGAGIDGLQKVCSTVIHGELDWSPQVHDQINSRVDRDGQEEAITKAYYLAINDGSDPTIMNTLSIKRSQHEGIIEGKVAEDVNIGDNQVAEDKIRKLAAAYLESLGEQVPESFIEEGLVHDISSLLKSASLQVTTEDMLQRAIDSLLKDNLTGASIVEREYKISKRSRVDFLVTRGDERVMIECKITQGERAATYKQVRRYIEAVPDAKVILVAPWGGVNKFKVDDTEVSVINISQGVL